MEPTERRTFNYHLAYHGCDPWRTMKGLRVAYERETPEGQTFTEFVMVKLDCPEFADAGDAVANFEEGLARQLAISEMEREGGLR